MASEMLSKVLKAEEADKQAQQEASEKALAVIEQAKAAAEKIIGDARVSAKIRGDEIIAAAKLEAQENEERARASALLKGEEITAAAAEHRSRAVKAAVELILS